MSYTERRGTWVVCHYAWQELAELITTDSCELFAGIKVDLKLCFVNLIITSDKIRSIGWLYQQSL